MLWILQIDFLCELVTLSLALNETNSEFWNFFNELQNEKICLEFFSDSSFSLICDDVLIPDLRSSGIDMNNGLIHSLEIVGILSMS